MAIKLSELAQKINCRLHGEDCLIENVADIDYAEAGHLAFIYNPKYLDKINTTKASAIITKEEWLQDSNKSFLVAENPRLAFVKATRILNPVKIRSSGVCASAVIAGDVKVPASVYIGENAVIQSGVVLGNNVQVNAGCVIENDVKIGDNTIIHANVSIGYNTQVVITVYFLLALSSVLMALV